MSATVYDEHSKFYTVPDGSVDVVVSQLALMDIADHRRMFTAARRVLTDEGVLVFSVLHPCFQSPCRLLDEPGFIHDQDGQPIAAVARRYAEEGFWRPGGDGVRGRMGSYHRMLSTYINDLQMSGFRLERLEEPLPPAAGLFSEEFAQLRLKFTDPIQHEYEIIRPIVLFDTTISERSRQTGIERTRVGEKTKRFVQQGMFGLVDQRAGFGCAVCWKSSIKTKNEMRNHLVKPQWAGRWPSTANSTTPQVPGKAKRMRSSQTRRPGICFIDLNIATSAGS